MHPKLNIPISIEYQKTKLAKKYKKQMAALSKINFEISKLPDILIRNSVADFYDKSGNSKLLPLYLILEQQYGIAWAYFHYLRPPWSLEDMNSKIFGRVFEKSDSSILKPYYEEYKKSNNGLMSARNLGHMCFVLDDPTYNESALKILRVGEACVEECNPSPLARHSPGDYEPGQYHMSYRALMGTLRSFEIFFRQERHAEAAECLFRLRFMLSKGDVTGNLSGYPRHKYLSPLINMYDRWFAARMQKNKKIKQVLAWEALFWSIESGIRIIGSPYFQFFQFGNFCEIIGEFALLGDQQNEFLRYFKRFAMQASMSVCRRMKDEEPQLIPFAERGLPTVVEFKKLYDNSDAVLQKEKKRIEKERKLKEPYLKYEAILEKAIKNKSSPENLKPKKGQGMNFTIEVSEPKVKTIFPVWPVEKIILTAKTLSMALNNMEESGIAMNLGDEALNDNHEQFLVHTESLHANQTSSYWDEFTTDYLNWHRDYKATLNPKDAANLSQPLSLDNIRDDVRNYIVYSFVRSNSTDASYTWETSRKHLVWSAIVIHSCKDSFKIIEPALVQDCDEVVEFLADVCFALDKVIEQRRFAEFKYIEGPWKGVCVHYDWK